MRDGAILSGVFHAAVITILVVGLPSFVDPPTTTLIPVELVILEEEEPPEPAPEPEPEPKPQPMAEEPAPVPEPPKEEAKAAPEPPPPEPEPAPPPPLPPPEAKPEPEKVVKPPPPKPRRRPDVKVAMPEKKKEPKPKPDQLTSILRNVEKLRDKPQPQREQIARADIPGPTSRSVSAFEQNEMVRAIQDQLRRCWRLDPGARGAEDMIIEIRVALNPDGSVRTAEIVDAIRMVQDAYFRSAAENAQRAINQCSPFQLPLRKYEVWRQLTLRFDPREMFGT